MEDEFKSREQLLEELEMLRVRVALLEANQLTHQDKLKLAIINRAPFTLWAADRDFKIKLWNETCEQIYGVRERDALGRDFVDLFVDEPEQEQARIDCIRVIDQDIVFSNLLAYDHSRDGRQRTMLTNCFRIWDVERQQFLQAEVALEISDLELRKHEHRTLREAGIAHLEQRRKAFGSLQRELMSRVGMAYLTKLRFIDERLRDLEGYRTRIARQFDDKVAEEVTVEQGQKLQDERAKVVADHDTLYQKVIKAQKLEELEIVEVEINKYEKNITE